MRIPLAASTKPLLRLGLAASLLAAALVLLAGPVRDALVLAQDRGTQRSFAVSARKYAFEPSRLEVQQDDLVTITFTAEDIPHSFTIDAYRIAKRAGAGQTVTFEFRAAEAGTFPFYCNLRIDEGCADMRGELIVHPRR